VLPYQCAIGPIGCVGEIIEINHDTVIDLDCTVQIIGKLRLSLRSLTAAP
jgi:hypothetical protein